MTDYVHEREMTDLHSHLLPGVDDGSGSVEQSVATLELMRKHGTTHLCLTPHISVAELYPEVLAKKLQVHDEAYAKLRASAPVSPRLHRGCELMVDRPLPREAVIDRRITLGASRYLLIEFPRDLTAAAAGGLVREIVVAGYVPLVAHVERYPGASLDDIFKWREAGAAIQVDANAVCANKGNRAARARSIVEAGLADVLAADNHGDARTLYSASNFLVAHGAEVQADYLLRFNPAAILDDTAIEAVPPIRLRLSIARFLRGIFARRDVY
jgi:protein-tyrosine phosphatase